MTRHLFFRPFLFCLALLLLGASVLMPDGSQAQVVVRLSDRHITIRGEEYLIHTVRKGETLYAVSKAYNVSQEEIMRANSLTKSVLRNKQTLLIPKRQGISAATSHRNKEPQQLPEPQMETVTPSVPKRTVPAETAVTVPPSRERLRQKEEIASTITDTITVSGQPGQDYRNGRLREIDREAPINMAILLPLQAGMRSNDKFSEYYKGILLGLNALKAEGVSVNARFLNTGASEEKVRDHIRSGVLDKASLIIGPVYADAFEPVAEFAARRGIPVVSPLGAVGAEENPYVYEAPPAEEYTYKRIFEMFDGRAGGPSEGANLILIDHVEYPDTAAVARIEAQLGDRVSTLSFSGTRDQSQAMDMRLNAVLDKGCDNIVFVPVNRVDALEGVLSHLSSINTNGRYRITVVGTPRWAWIGNINLDLFYKLNAYYPASYHADRSDPAVAEFCREYMDSFGESPSPYAFRGYDVVRYFGGALKRFGSDMPDRISDGGYMPALLQVGYDYRQVGSDNGNGGEGKYRNTAWPIVNFRPDYTIRVIR